jgi:hypothetical protein
MRMLPSPRRFKVKAAFTALTIALFAAPAFAQEAESGASDPRHSYDLNLNFGTFLSARTGIDQDVPGWGLRLSVPTAKGVFEFGGFSGIGHGAIYRSAALDYRLDVVFDSVAAHFLLGFHADQYDQTDPVIAQSKFSGGWHYGGGITQQLAGPILFRFDFRHRFSPGQALEVTLGLSYRIPEGQVGF